MGLEYRTVLCLFHRKSLRLCNRKTSLLLETAHMYDGKSQLQEAIIQGCANWWGLVLNFVLEGKRPLIACSKNIDDTYIIKGATLRTVLELKSNRSRGLARRPLFTQFHTVALCSLLIF